MPMPGGQNIMYFVVFSSKTAFFKLQDIFPECFLYREHAQQIDPLKCLLEDNACHVNHNCMEALAKRIHVLFQEVLPSVDMVITYFKKRGDRSYGAGLFWRDMREPQAITMNPFAWKRVKHRGSVYTFSPNVSFFLSGKAAPPEPTSEVSGLEQKI
jgi:hypothetical protein